VGKWLTVALFVGAVSYAVYSQEPERMLSPLPEEYAGSIDQVVPNASELVQFNEEATEEALTEAVSVGCTVSIDRLNDQDKVVSDWNQWINSRSKYEDSTFPARKDYALYWTDYLD